MTDELDQLRDLARDLPWDKPSAQRRDAVRSSLLVEAADHADARGGLAGSGAGARRWLTIGGAFTAGALAAAAIAVLLLRRDRPIDLPAPSRITASSEAKLEHRVVSTDTGIDEIVEIHTGKVTLAVPAVRRGDHVRVRTTTAEVEGDAGELEVLVVADALQSVAVRTGTAKIVASGQAPVFLAAGQTWRASVITTEISPPVPTPIARIDTPPRDPVSPSSEPSTTPTDSKVEPKVIAPKSMAPAPLEPKFVEPTSVPKPTEPTPTTPPAPTVAIMPAPTVAITPAPDRSQLGAVEKRFQHGWQLLREGKAREAAAELGAAADAMPEAPIAQDARYFQAVALVRAGDVAAAEKVLVQFLDHAPKSLRRGRAAVLLGRVLALRGDRAGARAWFESAVTDADPSIAAAARAGLQSLATR